MGSLSDIPTNTNWVAVPCKKREVGFWAEQPVVRKRLRCTENGRELVESSWTDSVKQGSWVEVS